MIFKSSWTRINLFISICLIVIAVCCAIPIRNNRGQDSIETDVTSYFVHTRAKRTIIVTRMRLFTILCIVFIATCSAIPIRTRSDKGDPKDRENDVTSNLVHKRAKRTIIGKIIQGAKLLLSENNFRKTHTDFRLFHKKGGLQEAIDDFRRLDPTDVRVVGGSREGRLGEKTVVVTSNPIKNTATMDIWKYSNVKNGGSYILRVDRIKYSRP